MSHELCFPFLLVVFPYLLLQQGSCANCKVRGWKIHALLVLTLVSFPSKTIESNLLWQASIEFEKLAWNNFDRILSCSAGSPTVLIWSSCPCKSRAISFIALKEHCWDSSGWIIDGNTTDRRGYQLIYSIASWLTWPLASENNGNPFSDKGRNWIRHCPTMDEWKKVSRYFKSLWLNRDIIDRYYWGSVKSYLI